MKVQVNHEVAIHDIQGLHKTGTVTVTRDDGKVIEGMYEVRGGKAKGYVLIGNTTDLGIRKAKAVLSKVGSTGVGEWETSWAELTE